uniref:Uncharacterized protein n=1 Tax=Arundo donax TaxID=35708 RepID=A0A0A8YXU0_ARUDO
MDDFVESRKEGKEGESPRKGSFCEIFFRFRPL